MVEAGAGGVEGRGGGVGGGERGDGGVEQQKQWKDPLAAQPGRKDELSQTNRGIGGVLFGLVPRIQSKPLRALHAHREKKLMQDLQN